MDYNELLAKLGPLEPRGSREGEYLTSCPAHNDTSPSLLVFPHADSVRVECLAHCNYRDVWKAIGVEPRGNQGLTGIPNIGISTKARPEPADAASRIAVASKSYMWATKLAACTSDDPVVGMLRSRFGIDPAELDANQTHDLGIGYDNGRLMVVARDAGGQVAFVQGRAVDPADPLRWKGLSGRWDACGFVGRVTGDRPVIICEGPSDALCVAALDAYDVVAVRGAANAKHIDELADALQERDVFVAGDGDDAGRKFNATIARTVQGAQVISLPDGKDIGDIRTGDPAGFADTLDALLDSATTATEETARMTSPAGTTDIELAEYAHSAEFGGHLAFSRSQGWRYFPSDGAHWVADGDGDEVRRAVQRLLRALLPDAENERQRQNLGSTAKRNNVVSAMESLGEVNYTGEWDATEHLLAAPNGVVDLRNGQLLPGAPDQRLTRAVKIPFNPDAKAPRFEQFMREIFAHDPEMPAYVQRLLGYGVTGSNAEQCFAVLAGEGSNGKSTLLTVLREILGEHAATVPFDMFTVTGKARGGPETEHLAGARLALASETNRTAVLDSAAIKNATGGEEINVNPKYRKPYSFTPQALILLATNYKPIIKEQDPGTWRRVKVLAFTQRFEKDPTLADALRAEYGGILAWLVRGAVEWYQHGLSDPASVAEAIESYRDESDALAGFLPGVLVADPERWTSNADVWAAYTQWADEEGMDAFRRSDTLNKAIIERAAGAVVARKKGGKRGLGGVVRACVLTEEALAATAPGIFRIDAAERAEAAAAGK